MTIELRRGAVSAPFRRMNFEARGMHGVQSFDLLKDYLRASNLRFTSLDPARTLQGRVAQFPTVTFAHVNMPRSTVEWPRDQLSLRRAAILVVANGRVSIDSAAPVLAKNPGLFFIPPGDAPLSILTEEESNELIYISIDATLLQMPALPTVGGDRRKAVSRSTIAPLYAFATTLCAISVAEAGGVEPLVAVAHEVARTLARIVVHGAPGEAGLFSEGMQIIFRDFARAELSGKVIASELGVSERTLQAAFAKHGATVIREIRQVRARAAVKLVESNPGLSSSRIAAAVGYGSVSSMFRGLREIRAN